MNHRPRILLIAEAANPQWVSVPLEGWSHSQALAKVADVHLVTHVRNRAALIEAGLKEDRDFTAIDSDRVAAPLDWLATRLRGGAGRGWTTVTAFQTLAYYYFERLVWKRFKSAITAHQFDVVHRLTPLTPTAPSSLAARCAAVKVPFVLGPLNGGLPWPREYTQARRREREWLSWLRGAHRLLPGYRATRRHAAAIIVGSTATFDQIPAEHRHKCVYIPENGIDPQRFTAVRRDGQDRPTGPIRVAFVGRLVDYKNPDVVIEALAPLAREGQVTVDVFGDGPLRDTLTRLIEQHDVKDSVRLHGWIGHEDLSSRLATMDLFAFPSIREFGGAVVLEAMAMGVVPIVADYGGPAELISPASGFTIPLADRATLITHLRAVIRDVAADPDVLSAMRTACLDRVRRLFTWEAKAGQVLEVYRWVLGWRDDKPDFGMPLPDTRGAQRMATEPAEALAMSGHEAMSR